MSEYIDAERRRQIAAGLAKPPPTLTPEQQHKVREAEHTATQEYLKSPAGQRAQELASQQTKWVVDGKTYDTWDAAERARIASTKYQVTYQEPGAAEPSTVEFKSQDQAHRFVEALNEPAIAAQKTYRPIPGPGAGPRPGSIGYEISSKLTGALMATETELEKNAQFLRNLSTKGFTQAASAKESGDVLGTIVGASAATGARIAAGIYEGATFPIRPHQWAALATLPIIAASNPTAFLNSIKADAGGIVLEGVGAFVGGFVLGKGMGLAKDLYAKSELAQFKKLHPYDPYGDYSNFTQSTDYSSNAKFGDYTSANKALDSSSFKPLHYGSPSQSAIEAAKVLKENAQFLKKLRSSYSSLLPVMELDEILLNPKLTPLLSAEKLGALTSLVPLTQLKSIPTTMTKIETALVQVPLTVSPSVVSSTRLAQQTKEMQKQEVEQIPIVIPAVIEDVTQKQEQKQEQKQAQIQTQAEIQKAVTTTITPIKLRLQKGKLKLKTHEFPEGSKFRVIFTFAKGVEKFVVPTRTFEGALVSALNSRHTKLDPVKTEIRRIA